MTAEHLSRPGNELIIVFFLAIEEIQRNYANAAVEAGCDEVSVGVFAVIILRNKQL